MKVDAHSSETGLDLKTHRLCCSETWDVISLPFSRREVYRAVQEGTVPLCLSPSVHLTYLRPAFTYQLLQQTQFPSHFIANTKRRLQTSKHSAQNQSLPPSGCEHVNSNISPKRQGGSGTTPASTQGDQRGPSGRGSPRVRSHAPAMWFSFTLMLNSFSGNWGAWSFTSRILMLKTKELSKSFPVKRSTTSK